MVIDAQPLDVLKRRFLTNRRLMILSVTRSCDRRCLYCRGSGEDSYDRLSQDGEAAMLDRYRWQEVVVLCRELEVAAILITGGEPTLYPYAVELTAFLHAAGLPCTVHTHGMGLSCMSFLEQCAVAELRPTIHLSSELFEDHQVALRGGKRPVAFVDAAVSLGHSIELKVVLHEGFTGREASLEEQLAWWRGRGVASFRFQPAVPVNGSCVAPPSLTTVSALLRLKSQPNWHNSIRNSEASFNVMASLIGGNEIWRKAAQTCNISDRIVFLSPELGRLTCKTLWKKSVDVTCEHVFDLVCCGYQM